MRPRGGCGPGLPGGLLDPLCAWLGLGVLRLVPAWGLSAPSCPQFMAWAHSTGGGLEGLGEPEKACVMPGNKALVADKA
jgi:hypothetical protein